MAHSRGFRELSRRVQQLRKRLLPRRFSPLGRYSPVELDHARAYTLLICAEIEHFLEQRASLVADSAFTAWTSGNRSTKVIVNLLARVAPLSFDGKGPGSATTSTIVGKCLGHYKERIRSNNGIGSGSLHSLLAPIGIDLDSFDPIWLGTVNSFVQRRGERAHASHIVHLIDPASELQDVEMIMKGLKLIDAEMEQLLRSTK